MIVLGISAYYHDSAAALVVDGVPTAAAQEERFSRIKGDAGFPRRAIAFCLDQAGITLDQVTHVAYYDKPLLTFDRLLETYLAFAPSGFSSFCRSMPVWMKRKLLLKSTLRRDLERMTRGAVDEERILFNFHHNSHAASAFFPSPFDTAAVLTIDGVGEWATTSLARGTGSSLDLLSELRFPHSLGLLYSAFTQYLGFGVNDGEYKVMGLAPFGEPAHVQHILDNLMDLKDDGSFRLRLDCFDYCVGLTMINRRFESLFDGAPPRRAGQPLERRHLDIARSIQAVAEEVVLRLSRHLHRVTGLSNLCMAGGVALNCVANGRVLREGPFDRIWIQPAAGDAGGALGAALSVAHVYGQTRRADGATDAMNGALLGPAFDDDEIRAILDGQGAVYECLEDRALFETVADALASEKVVGWFQDRMEFGPRALGNRSILGDPRSPAMQRLLNRKIKYREGFRPFAPAVLRDRAGEYFQLAGDSPYMLLVAPVTPAHRRPLTADETARTGLEMLDVVRSDLPAVTHVDYSARVQTVDENANPRFHRLLRAFEERTGCGVLVNTSFNVRDEPIVCTPADAFRCFMATEIDVAVIGNMVLRKEAQ